MRDTDFPEPGALEAVYTHLSEMLAEVSRLQVLAVLERGFPYFLQSIWKRDTLQPAPAECALSDDLQTLRELQFFKAHTSHERGVIDARQLRERSNVHLSELRTAEERVRTYLFNTRGNPDLLQMQVLEAESFDRVKALREIDLPQTRAAAENVRARDGSTGWNEQVLNAGALE